MSKQLCGIAFLLLGNILAQTAPFLFWTGLAVGIIGIIMVLVNTERKDN